jgi:hypothetical protein
VILDSPDGYIKVRIRAHNFGQTPAYKAQVNGGTMFFHDPLLATEAIPETAYDRSEKSSAVTIFPAKGEGTDIPTSVMVEKPRTQELEDGRWNLYVVGKITYEDTFGYLWFTDFCIIIKPVNLVKVGPSRFSWCLAKYNHAT